MIETVLVDSRGARWMRTQEYQEDRPGEYGFLTLASDRGEKEIYEWVVERFGFRDDRLDGKPYLIGFLSDEATEELAAMDDEERALRNAVRVRRDRNLT
jgi:hypothetical protein